VHPAYDASIERELREYFGRFATVAFDNYPVEALRDAPCAVAAERTT
jgi:hypothetical protein